MRQIPLALLTAIGLSFAGAQAALAADIPLKAPPPPPPPFSWTGFYIGVNGGAGSGTTQTSINAGAALAGLIPGIGLTLPLPSQTFTGWLGGVQAGYNWQTGPVVFGIEAEWDGSNMQGNTACILVFNCNVKHDWVADVAGRFGVVTFDRALVYVKGGAAWAESKYNIGNSISFGGFTLAANANASNTPVGGLFGVGVEYAFLPNWSAKIEYNYIDFGTQNLSFPLTTTPAVAGLPTIPAQVKETMQIVKAGVNYRFSYGP